MVPVTPEGKISGFNIFSVALIEKIYKYTVLNHRRIYTLEWDLFASEALEHEKSKMMADLETIVEEQIHYEQCSVHNGEKYYMLLNKQHKIVKRYHGKVPTKIVLEDELDDKFKDLDNEIIEGYEPLPPHDFIIGNYRIPDSFGKNRVKRGRKPASAKTTSARDDYYYLQKHEDTIEAVKEGEEERRVEEEKKKMKRRVGKPEGVKTRKTKKVQNVVKVPEVETSLPSQSNTSVESVADTKLGDFVRNTIGTSINNISNNCSDISDVGVRFSTIPPIKFPKLSDVGECNINTTFKVRPINIINNIIKIDKVVPVTNSINNTVDVKPNMNVVMGVKELEAARSVRTRVVKSVGFESVKVEVGLRNVEEVKVPVNKGLKCLIVDSAVGSVGSIGSSSKISAVNDNSIVQQFTKPINQNKISTIKSLGRPMGSCNKPKIQVDNINITPKIKSLPNDNVVGVYIPRGSTEFVKAIPIVKLKGDKVAKAKVVKEPKKRGRKPGSKNKGPTVKSDEDVIIYDKDITFRENPTNFEKYVFQYARKNRHVGIAEWSIHMDNRLKELTSELKQLMKEYMEVWTTKNIEMIRDLKEYLEGKIKDGELPLISLKYINKVHLKDYEYIIPVVHDTFCRKEYLDKLKSRYPEISNNRFHLNMFTKQMNYNKQFLKINYDNISKPVPELESEFISELKFEPIPVPTKKSEEEEKEEFRLFLNRASSLGISRSEHINILNIEEFDIDESEYDVYDPEIYDNVTDMSDSNSDDISHVFNNDTVGSTESSSEDYHNINPNTPSINDKDCPSESDSTSSDSHDVDLNVDFSVDDFADHHNNVPVSFHEDLNVDIPLSDHDDISVNSLDNDCDSNILLNEHDNISISSYDNDIDEEIDADIPLSDHDNFNIYNPADNSDDVLSSSYDNNILVDDYDESDFDFSENSYDDEYNGFMTNINLNNVTVVHEEDPHVVETVNSVNSIESVESVTVNTDINVDTDNESQVLPEEHILLDVPSDTELEIDRQQAVLRKENNYENLHYSSYKQFLEDNVSISNYGVSASNYDIMLENQIKINESSKEDIHDMILRDLYGN